MFEADIGNAFENRYVPKEELPEEGAVALAGKKTQETVNATDSIIEALDMADEELKRIAEYEVCRVLPFYSLCATCYILIQKISIKISLFSSSFISNLCSESSDLIIDIIRYQYDISSLVSTNSVIFQEEKSKGKVADFRPNILMLGLSPPDYVLRALSNVDTNDLEQTLLVSVVTQSCIEAIYPVCWMYG